MTIWEVEFPGVEESPGMSIPSMIAALRVPSLRRLAESL